MKIINLPVNDLIPYINNQKMHPEEQVKKIAASIKEFGFLVPIIIDENNEVLAGHGRIQAAKLLEMDKVPVIKVTNLTEAQMKAFRIADNKVSESPWDEELVKLELSILDELEFDYSELGFDFDFTIEDVDIEEENEGAGSGDREEQKELIFKLSNSEYEEAIEKLQEIAKSPENALKILLKMEI
jgi:ParB-like chromosome segregation protein Spo0J